MLHAHSFSRFAPAPSRRGPINFTAKQLHFATSKTSPKQKAENASFSAFFYYLMKSLQSNDEICASLNAILPRYARQRYVGAFAPTRYYLAMLGSDMSSLCSDEVYPLTPAGISIAVRQISSFEYLACGEVFKTYRKSHKGFISPRDATRITPPLFSYTLPVYSRRYQRRRGGSCARR